MAEPVEHPSGADPSAGDAATTTELAAAAEETSANENSPKQTESGLKSDGSARKGAPTRPALLMAGLGLTAVAAMVPAVAAILGLLHIELTKTGELILTCLLVATGAIALVASLNRLVRETLPDARPATRRLVVAGSAAAGAVLLGGLLLLRDPFANLPQLTGTQDIAVLGFVRPDGSHTAQLDAVSTDLADGIENEIARSQVASYAGLTKPPLELLRDPEPDQLESWTSDFVDNTGAEIVIAGIIDDVSGIQVRAQPAIWVRPGLIPEAPELVGWIVGTSAPLTGGLSSQVARDQLVDAYLSDAVALASFVSALDNWRAGNPEEAQETLDELLQSAEGSTSEGTLLSADMLHLFRGHALQMSATRGPVEQRADMLDEAAADYAAIDSSSPLNVRAQLSAATNDYLRSVGDLCRRDTVDANRLDSAAFRLDALRVDERLTDVGRLTAEVNFSRARRCLDQAAGTTPAAALRQSLNRVRNTPDKTGDVTGPIISSLKSLSRSMEAEISMEEGDLETAITLMSEAIDLSGDAVDRWRWWGFIALWNGELCALNEARAARTEAMAQMDAAVSAGELPSSLRDDYAARSQRDLDAAEDDCAE
jgi:tetratricopeptide (TPR) repeat protein